MEPTGSEAPGEKVPTAETVVEPQRESTMFNVSVRGLLACVVLLTVCFASLTSIEIKEPLYTLATTIVAFYYGHQVGTTKR